MKTANGCLVKEFQPTSLFKRGLIWLVGFALAGFSNLILASKPDTPLNNQLRGHPAPYLALHGEDPVAWQQWDEQTVARAKRENKILLLSVGYFACHWCHVMQRETYQDEQVAQLLNDSYIPVKIDRELEPALDLRLTQFAQKTIGRAAWPLNVFITPEGYPMHVVLYAPKVHFMRTATQLQTLWEKDPEQIRQLVRTKAEEGFALPSPDLDKSKFERIVANSVPSVMARADQLSGGFGEQNKFPWVPQVQFLLNIHQAMPNSELGEFLRLTLDSMNRLGLNDHLSGGFFRYTVDPNWSVPHFEKMLDDNANLAALYLNAAKVFGAEHYRQVAMRTLDFMQRSMMHRQGGMVSSLSAVNEQGEEGAVYLWDDKQLSEVLDADELTLVRALWRLDRPHELPGGNHLRYYESIEQVSTRTGEEVSALKERLLSASTKLLRVREMRELPIDDKRLAGWNGLALHAFALAASQPGMAHYRSTARQLRNYLINHLWDDTQLLRAVLQGKPHGSASLEDYSYVARGLLTWAELTGEPSDFQLVRKVVEQGWSRFFRKNGWFSEDTSLLADPGAVDLMPDRGNPSSASVLISTTLALSRYVDIPHYKQLALSALNRGEERLRRFPFWYVSHLSALRLALRQP